MLGAVFWLAPVVQWKPRRVLWLKTRQKLKVSDMLFVSFWSKRAYLGLMLFVQQTCFQTPAGFGKWNPAFERHLQQLRLSRNTKNGWQTKNKQRLTNRKPATFILRLVLQCVSSIPAPFFSSTVSLFVGSKTIIHQFAENVMLDPLAWRHGKKET